MSTLASSFSILAQPGVFVYLLRGVAFTCIISVPKESLLYREIFEEFYPGQARMVPDFWMPNKSWEGCNVNDPSARVLSNYGDSGK